MMGFESGIALGTCEACVSINSPAQQWKRGDVRWIHPPIREP